MKLKQPKGNYKNEEKWLKKVYSLNKNYLEHSFPKRLVASTGKYASPYENFVFAVRQQYEQHGATRKEALENIVRSSSFSSKGDEDSYKLYQENIYKGIYGSKTSLKKFKEALIESVVEDKKKKYAKRHGIDLDEEDLKQWEINKIRRSVEKQKTLLNRVELKDFEYRGKGIYEYHGIIIRARYTGSIDIDYEPESNINHEELKNNDGKREKKSN